jgi:hypothetical protein
MAKKVEPESKPAQPAKEAQARCSEKQTRLEPIKGGKSKDAGQSDSPEAPWSPAAEMADIVYRAGLKEFPTVTPEERRGLRGDEIRQLHIARLLQRSSQLPAPPIPTQPTPASPAEPPLLQRKRGPANTHDWHTINGKIMRHLLDADGRLAVPENESLITKAILQEYADSDRDISESEVREAVRRVCAELRKGPQPLAKPRKKPSSR